MKFKVHIKFFYALSAIVFLFFVFSSCNSKNCECPFSDKDLKYNDSLLTVIKPKLKITFDEFNALPLYESEFESYRLTV